MSRTRRMVKGFAMAAATLLSTGGALVGMADVASAAPFGNGSFEEPARTGAFATLNVGDQMGPWVVVAGQVDHVRDAWQAADGVQSVDLNGLVPGRICQAFDTVAGAAYTLDFALSRNYNASSATASVTIDAAAHSVTHNAAGVTAADMKWEPRSLPFTADGSTAVCFGGADTGGDLGPAVGPAVDNVRINRVVAANTPPTATIITPPDGAVYYQGQAVLAEYSCADAEDASVSCVGTFPGAAQIDTGNLGTHTFQVVATDSGGLTGTDTHTYTIVPVLSLCRGTAASALGIVLGRANEPTTPCATDTETVVGENQFLGNQLPWPFSQFNSTLRLSVVSSTTELTPGMAAAESSIASATINIPVLGLNIALAGIHSSARSQLLGGCGPATVTSLSRVGTLIINGAPILVADSPVSIPLIVGTLHLNQELRLGNNIIRRAAFLDLTGTALDVVLGETIAGVHCAPPPPAP